MHKHASMATLIALALLAGCSHGASVPPVMQKPANARAASSIPQSVVTTGYFTEYSLPAGVNPSDLTRGPYNTIYFVGSTEFGTPSTIYRMADTNGATHKFTAPDPYENWGNAIISFNRSVLYVVVDHTVPGDAFYFARLTPEDVFSVSPSDYFEDRSPTNFVLASNGSIWYGACTDPCGGGDGYVGRASLPGNWVPNWVAAGPGANVSAVATDQLGGPPDTSVFIISSTGTILHQFALPNGISPNDGGTPLGITTGSDNNLWVTAPGINKIIRVTPTGTITQFPLPTPNAGPNRIVAGYYSALFFTETTANKIGRITTSGSITEYPIPTADSGATGITPCSSVHCGTHAGVWFTETKANKIGRFNSPI